MAWGDNGVTEERVTLDQSYNINWLNATLRLPTKPFNQVGYLRRAVLQSPPTAVVFTITSAHPELVNNGPSGSTPLFNAAGHMGVQSLRVIAQGIAPIYDLGRGRDLMYLDYVGNGKRRLIVPGQAALSEVATTNTMSLARPSASWKSLGNYAAVSAAYNAGVSQNGQYACSMDIPFTEWIRFPAGVINGPNGPVAVQAQEVEVGLITLQNTQQNIVPQVVLNPLNGNGATKAGSPFLDDATPPSAGTLATTFNLYTEFYDVPDNPGDRPPPYSQMFVIQRTSNDFPVSGGKVVYPFQPAGMLMRAIYTFEDTNGYPVDISNLTEQSNVIGGPANPGAQGADGQITFLWGSSVIKRDETFQLNLQRATQLYGDVPPGGCLIHDFFEDHSLVDMVNTATLTSVRASLKGIPTAVTNLHVIEERMIPVRQGPGA